MTNNIDVQQQRQARVRACRRLQVASHACVPVRRQSIHDAAGVHRPFIDGLAESIKGRKEEDRICNQIGCEDLADHIAQP